MVLRNKIIDLFTYRGIPQLINKVEPNEEIRNRFLEKLIDIQTNIYHLDDVLESEWHVLERDLNSAWKAIFDSLKSVGVPGNLHSDYCRHIFKYQDHELGQRKGRSLLRFKMEYFYFYKSCDVKLIRRLAYEKYPSLNKLCTLSHWRWFDLITEVNDDIDDVFEDIGTNNGNRFLLTIQEKGLDIALGEFQEFIKQVAHSFHAKSDVIPANSLIARMTAPAIKETSLLLSNRAGELRQKGVIHRTTRQQLSEHI